MFNYIQSVDQLYYVYTELVIMSRHLLRGYLHWCKSLPNQQLRDKHRSNVILYAQLAKLPQPQQYAKQCNTQQLSQSLATLQSISNQSPSTIQQVMRRNSAFNHIQQRNQTENNHIDNTHTEPYHKTMHKLKHNHVERLKRIVEQQAQLPTPYG